MNYDHYKPTIKGVTLTYFAHGKHGIIFTGILHGRKVGVKVKHPTSTAPCSLEKEARFLEIVNKKHIGPQLIEHADQYVLYAFVEGQHLQDWIKDAAGKSVQNVILDLLHQCKTLDALGIDKQELLRPYKNVLITPEEKPVMIDFERCKEVTQGKNVTQFVQFLTQWKAVLEAKGLTIDVSLLRTLAQDYKNGKKVFTQLLSSLTS